MIVFRSAWGQRDGLGEQPREHVSPRRARVSKRSRLCVDRRPRDPVGTYQATSALYRSNLGLYLLEGFEPYDGEFAVVQCGRRWRAANGWTCLSNQYSALALRFGLQVPRIFTWPNESAFSETLDGIVQCLKETLPIVLEKTTIEDLIAIENERAGCSLWQP